MRELAKQGESSYTAAPRNLFTNDAAVLEQNVAVAPWWPTTGVVVDGRGTQANARVFHHDGGTRWCSGGRCGLWWLAQLRRSGWRLAAPVSAEPESGEPPLSLYVPGGASVDVASEYLAGYRTTQIGISRATVSFDVPTMTCGPDTQGTAVGIGNSPIAGSYGLVGFVFVGCQFGEPMHYLQTLAGSDLQTGAQASAGDRITITVSQTSSSAKVTVKNVTTGETTTPRAPPTPTTR